MLLAAVVGWGVWPDAPGHRASDHMIEVRSGPDDATQVTLDTTLYLPTSATASHKVPAVLLAHGFGGTKQSVAPDADDFADRGYAVLTWTARGFGRRPGRSTWTARTTRCGTPSGCSTGWRPARRSATEAPGDPRVGVVGGRTAARWP